LFDAIRAVLIALITCIALTLILSLGVRVIGISNRTILPLVQAIKMLSVLLGCIFGIKSKTNGALKGAIVGLVFSFLSIIAFLIMGGKSSEISYSISDLASSVAAGIISGVIAVNVGQKN
jgi:putative membrane protein (TIGR04086 family)